MVNAAGGIGCLAGIADNSYYANNECTGQRLGMALQLRRGTAFVCSNLAGDIFSMRGPEYAAAGNAADIGTVTDADALRRINAHGKYAPLGSKSHAGGTYHTLCGILPGYIVPWSRDRSGLETIPETLSDRHRAVYVFTGKVPQKRGPVSRTLSPRIVA